MFVPRGLEPSKGDQNNMQIRVSITYSQSWDSRKSANKYHLKKRSQLRKVTVLK